MSSGNVGACKSSGPTWEWKLLDGVLYERRGYDWLSWQEWGDWTKAQPQPEGKALEFYVRVAKLKTEHE